MGQVYRARDLRLQRDVALKVLPESFVQNADSRARFEREARVLASVNHANIAAIYGIEEAPGADGRPMPVLVLELVEGQSLERRIAAGPIRIDETIAIALQIAEALEAAHDRGIIHRDLKPGNVQVTAEGTVKVLDFGLAKALASASETEAGSGHGPTITSAETQLGVIMGTAAYMAPEQARGKTVDRRADIWAFGVVLFEMLTGQRAFRGETISDTLAAVLTGEPGWARLPKGTPPSLHALLHRCLERDPRQRLQSIGEARIVLSNPAVNAPYIDPATKTRARVPAVAAAAVVIAAVLLTAAVAYMTRGDEAAGAAPTRKLDFALDHLQSRLDRLPSLSPDGSRILYVAADKLWTRSLAEFTPREIPNSDGASYPFWSPDSRQVAFVRNSGLWRATVDGGEPEYIGAVPPDMTGSGAGVWMDDGNLALVGSDRTGILQISGRDGSAREILALDRKVESDFHEASRLPGGRGLLATAHATQGTDTILVFAEGKRRDVLKLPGESLRSPAYHPAGYLIYGRESNRRGVWAVRFSLTTLSTEGDPFLVDASGNNPSVANDGTIAIVRPADVPTELVWIDRLGSVSQAGTLPGQVPIGGQWPPTRLSPDNQKVAVTIYGSGGEELWLYDLKRGVGSPITRGAQMAVWPTFLPDASRVLFSGFAGGRAFTIHVVSTKEIGTPQRVLAPSLDPQWPVAVTPDGKSILYVNVDASQRNEDLWTAPIDRPAEAKPLMQTPARELEGAFSPDGRWLAYISDEPGRPEVFVRRYPIADDRVQISNGGAASVHWSSDGRQLFYRSGAWMMAVGVSNQGDRLDASAPQRLFAIDTSLGPTFEVAGDRFLFTRATGSDRISVILNWTPPVSK
jgi:serine/threonine protein kinase